MLEAIVESDSLEARAVVAFYPANSKGDDILVFDTDECDLTPRWILHGLRQTELSSSEFCHCLSDFVAPLDSGKRDYIGGFAVSAGFGCAQMRRK